MEIDRNVVEFLHAQRASAPADLKEYFSKFEDLYDRKLWHQLTISIQKFVLLPSAAPYLIPLYENFITDFDKKLNQLSLVQYATRASRQFKDPAESLSFLKALATSLSENPDAKDAYVLATVEVAHYNLLTGNIELCKKEIDECEKILDDLPGTDPTINASFYRVAANYYKAKALYPQYYHNALLFLSSVNLEELAVEEKIERAFDLTLSALLGEGLYNFGELLMHQILDSLTGTPFQWLRELLFVFNSGNMDSFEKICKSPDFLKQPLLFNSIAFLRQKLCLMTLVESVFKRSKEERGNILFKDIARECRVQLDEVEHLVMKALSLGLVRGKINEVDNIVEVTWVQPRVLDRAQIQTISNKLAEWSAKVNEKVKGLEMEEGAQDLFVQ
ncbi:26S proteasome regulatory subunit [Nowakowskiella sp. JEL0407]|nr:26S proteasome regulatory subunit [Nowakowskiella sp. JEL0407]